MPFDDDVERRLEDMLEAIERIERYTAGDDATTRRRLHALEGAVERLRVRAHGAAVVVDQETGCVSLAMRTYLQPETVSGRCYALAGLAAVQARQALAARAHAEATLGPDASAWRQTADALHLYGLDTPVRQDDAGLTYADHCGDHGARILLGLMHDDLTGPAVAVSTLLQLPGDAATARATRDALQRVAQQLRVWGEALAPFSASELDRHGKLDGGPRGVACQRRAAERERQAEAGAVSE